MNNTDRDTALILATNMLKNIAEEPETPARDYALHILAKQVTELTQAAA
tara:strand:- start:358 stop:504 length:147 start_codon:yes stop_codon:yes gene_type:complete